MKCDMMHHQSETIMSTDYGTWVFSGWSPTLETWIAAGLNPKSEIDVISLVMEAE